MANIHSISLGCPKNRVDTENLLGSLSGVTSTADPARADCIFINTCGFIAPAVQESIRTILECAADKEEAPAAKRPLLVVAGCLVGRYGEAELAPDLPEVDLWLDTRDIAAWPEKLSQALGLPAPAPGPGRRLLSTPPSYAWLKISEGCNHRCSFCTIPVIRGPLASRPAADIIADAAALLSQGVKELVVVAQDTTAWGKERAAASRDDIRTLLDDLLPLQGLERLRLLYLYPAGLTRDLLTYLQAAGPPFVPYFDIPLQHAHPDILRAMGRPFALDPRPVIERVREFFPQAALRTTFITGFPGETEEAFQNLYDFISEVRFQHLGVFAYQAEEGTAAAALPGQIPETIKESRRETLMLLQQEISEELLAPLLGRRLPILVDSPHPEWPGLHTGRAWFQAPEIDGVTYISGPGVAPGALVEAEITETKEYDLVALV